MAIRSMGPAAGEALEPLTRAMARDDEDYSVLRALILATLEHFHGDKRQAAKTLGVSLKTLYNRLDLYQSTAAAAMAA